MGLAAFIINNKPSIIAEWENFARTLIPASTAMAPLALRNHISEILNFIVRDMEIPQTMQEQEQKSYGEGRQKDQLKPSAAETHAALRLAGGFNIDQMVSEYRALRASIIKLWKATVGSFNGDDMEEMVRFNEAIDQALTESIRHYAKNLDDSRNLFLGILTHDIRNPLSAMMGAAELIPRIGSLNDRQKAMTAQISESGGRINEIISHLLDITKARFGSGLPVVRSEMDMGYIARMMVEEMRALHPDRKFVVDVSGETTGNWDKARIGQVFSNLLGNAVQYSFADTPIAVIVKGDDRNVILSVHNEGVPILPEKIGRVFDSLTRAAGVDELPDEGTLNLGLGLFITREIVITHGGIIRVESSEMSGTTFTAYFPRHNLSDSEEGRIPGLP